MWKESGSGKERPDLIGGTPRRSERGSVLAAGNWRKSSCGIRRHVPVEPGQVRSADGLGTIAQSRMARDQPEVVGRFFEVLGLGLGAAPYCGVGRGFQTGAASESIHGSARKNRTPCLSFRAGYIGAAKRAVKLPGGRSSEPPLAGFSHPDTTGSRTIRWAGTPHRCMNFSHAP